MEISSLLPKKLLAWYEKNKRNMPWRENPIPYYVWLSEIMLQQTRVETVIPYFQRFIRILPDIHALASVDEETLLKLWEGLGYYRRVYNLQKAAKIVDEEFGGNLPASYEQLRKLPGIGEYTAGAISSIAFGLPRVAVDGNVLRVISRITGDYRDITGVSIKKEVAAALESIYPKKQSGDFTQSLMELGALICIPHGIPKCDVCPLREMCFANLHHCTDELPVKPEKKKRQIQFLSVFIIKHQNTFAVQKRTQKGLLQGLWELPNMENPEKTESISDFLKNYGIIPCSILKHKQATHIFSHVEWHMTAYIVESKNKSDLFRWVTSKELLEEISLPSAFQHFSDVWK